MRLETSRPADLCDWFQTFVPSMDFGQSEGIFTLSPLITSLRTIPAPAAKGWQVDVEPTIGTLTARIGYRDYIIANSKMHNLEPSSFHITLLNLQP